MYTFILIIYLFFAAFLCKTHDAGSDFMNYLNVMIFFISDCRTREPCAALQNYQKKGAALFPDSPCGSFI